MHRFVMTLPTEGQHAVTMYQTADGKNPRFCVVYGEHKRQNLDYAMAASEFGSCAMHAATCAGNLRQRER